MTKLIKNWQELAEVPANDKYRIIVNFDMHNGWIVPVCDEPANDEYDLFKCNCKQYEDSVYFTNHRYLSTHTFYGNHHEYSTKLLQTYGFDIEIDNWDKEDK